VGKEDEHNMGKSITEGNVSFSGQMARLPEVAAAKEREESRGKKGGRKKSPAKQLCVPKCASLDGALLFYKGASVGGTLLSTVARVGCHVYTPGHQLRWCPVVFLGRQAP
jgi:hypothetical protein